MSEPRTWKEKPKSVPPLASLKGYKLSYLPNDLIAGTVVAALTLPISMGYAELVGVPAVYGLYASIVATLVFALVTGTTHLVFGMDSATSAVAGTTIASMGLVLGSQDVVAIMPVFTVAIALFLLVFWVFKAGRLVRYVPATVMHGFVAGISLAVCISQIPTLLGTGYHGPSGFPGGTIAIFASIPAANIPSACIAAGSILVLVLCKRFIPKAPGPLIVLLIATAATGLLRLDEQGVAILGAVDAGLPRPSLPSLAGVDAIGLVGGAFSVAVVITIESLLCLETFSIKTGARTEGNREVLSFSIANLAGGVFGCPPCSASISRTAAAMDSRGRSQVTSIAAAVFIAAVILVLSPLLYYLPRPALSAIVFMALVGVVEYKRIASYARHARLEFAVFAAAAIAVFLWGAIPGVAAGILASFIVARYREKRTGQAAMLGIPPQPDPSLTASGEHERPNPGVPYSVFSIKGRLNFLNVDDAIDRILKRLEPESKAVILKVSKVESIDATATDKLCQFIELLHARGLHVKLVRKVRPTDDSYTRHELRTVLGEAKVYPSVREALEGLTRDFSDQRIEVEVPFLTVTQEMRSENSKSFSGKIRFPQSEEKLRFNINVDTAGKPSRENEVFSYLTISDESRENELVRYAYGTWTWNQDSPNARAAVKRLRAFAESLS